MFCTILLYPHVSQYSNGIEWQLTLSSVSGSFHLGNYKVDGKYKFNLPMSI